MIKHSALGDFILALGPFKAIRAHHPGSHITLWTTAPYAGLARASGYFDHIEIDPKPKAWQLGAWRALRRRLREGRFDRVYDLQHSDRTHAYFRFFGRDKPEWSGIAKGGSHPHTNPRRNSLHTIERQAEQLAAAGIAETPATDISWLTADLARFRLPERFALLVPGGAPHRPDKRWPASGYAALARDLAARGTTPVVIGTAAESTVIADILREAPKAVSLEGQTGFAEIAELARRAAVAVGNDTGPMHIVAAAGAPSLVLFSKASNPAQTQPRGPVVRTLQRDRLADLAVEEVVAALPPFRGG